MTFRVEIASAARKQMRVLPGGICARIDSAIRALANDPRPHGCRQMAGYPDIYRIRVGDYRILYRIQDDALTIMVVRVGHRREIYRNI